jgi:hypothetical protein
MIPGLSITHVWLTGRLGTSVSEPAVLTGLDRFQQGLESDPDVVCGDRRHDDSAHVPLHRRLWAIAGPMPPRGSSSWRGDLEWS